jgi:formylglycine-generating enzyme required for sulfatase activity
VWFISNTQRHKQIAEQQRIALALIEQQIADSVATVRADSVAKVREAESQAAIREAERQAWQTALNANTIIAYDGYLRDYPTGENAARAMQRKAQLEEQSRFASYTETAAGLNLRMVAVKGGAFTMGCTAEQGSDCYDSEKPTRRVTVGDYYIGKFEVTQKQWRAVMGASATLSNPSHFKGCDDCPVESVSWNDIQEFIKELNRQTGKRYRLPTEAEWEFAARGGAQSRGYKYAGSNNIDEVAEYDGNNNKSTKPVGGKKANELGIYDMSGNVWEWCEDWYTADFYKTNKQLKDPVNNTPSSNRVLRGGSWYGNAQGCRVSYRYGNTPGHRNYYYGFRLACFP